MNTLSLLRGFNSVAGHIIPALPARHARSLLLRPRRRRAKAWEHEMNAGAERISFRFGLSGLRWGRPGPTVLLMHGWEGRPTQFRYFIEPLLQAGRQVIALDGPAHGDSPGDEATLMGFSTALQEAAVEIPELESVIGHSMGAAALVLALSNGLPAEKAVLISPPSAIETGLYGFASQLGLPGNAARQFVRLVEEANGIPAWKLDLSLRTPKRQIPVLVVHDRQDRVVPFGEGEAIAKAWEGAELMATDGLGHNGVLTDSKVIERVTRFLE